MPAGRVAAAAFAAQVESGPADRTAAAVAALAAQAAAEHTVPAAHIAAAAADDIAPLAVPRILGLLHVLEASQPVSKATPQKRSVSVLLQHGLLFSLRVITSSS